MSDEREAFIREIVTHPDEDAPRLIYADWLEERGDPQGEFIRVQCELAASPQSARCRELRQREAAILAAYREEWVRSLGGELIRAIFRRGLMEHLQAIPKSFFSNRTRWFQQAPVSTLEVRLDKGDVSRFTKCSELQYARSLRVGGSELGDDRCIRLLNSSYLRRLDELWLTSTSIGPSAVRRLVESPLATRLRVLILSGNALGNEGGGILADARPLPALEALYISSCGIDRSFVDRIKRQHPALQHISHS
jgi:uncharacterized protein (TIGR02996 family)